MGYRLICGAFRTGHGLDWPLEKAYICNRFLAKGNSMKNTKNAPESKLQWSAPALTQAQVRDRTEGGSYPEAYEDTFKYPDTGGSS